MPLSDRKCMPRETDFAFELQTWETQKSVRVSEHPKEYGWTVDIQVR